MSNEYNISDVLVNEWRVWAKYTVEKRAIPSCMDGLKPVQRFYLYSSLMNSKNDFKRVSAVSGVVSDYGYNHAETSASDAGQLMAADWSNNLCFLEYEGNFGSRINRERGAPRYTYTKLGGNFWKYFKDTELAPEHYDPEHIPPAYYLPVLPIPAINGCHGTATGFATKVLPRSIDDVTNAVEKVIKGTKIRSNTLKPSFPKCESTFEYVSGRWIESCAGSMTRPAKTKLVISELPYATTREKYINHLEKLKEKDLIVSYIDDTDEKFCFIIKLKNDNKMTEEELLKIFDLVKPHTENINLIDVDGIVRNFSSIEEYIMYFVEQRKPFLEKRIETQLAKSIEEARFDLVVVEFINAVLDGRITFKGFTSDEVKKQIRDNTKAKVDDADRLIRMNIVSLTKEKVEQLTEKAAESKKKIKYWKGTSIDEQFMSDLAELHQ